MTALNPSFTVQECDQSVIVRLSSIKIVLNIYMVFKATEEVHKVLH